MSDPSPTLLNEFCVPFQSRKNPAERGQVVLTEDGEIVVRPNDEFIDELARQEEQIAGHYSRTTVIVGAAVIGLGGLLAVLGWLVGRIGGKLRERVTTPRKVDDVVVYSDVTGGFHLFLPDKLGRTLELNWGPGEVDVRSVADFLRECRKFRSKKSNKPLYR